MSVQKTGDWSKLDRMFSDVGPRFERNIQAATDKNGRMLEAGMVETIEKEGYGAWPALQPETIKRKAKAGREKMLQWTGQLMAGIRYARDAWNSGFVGIRRNVKRAEGGDLVNVAAVHEMGSPARNIPARPFAAPTGKRFEEQVAKNYDEAVEKTFSGT